MAATGKTPILIYGSTTATNAPVAGNLTNSSDGCEIAINVADKNLFFKDATNTVNIVPIRQSSASSNGWLSSTDWSTFNGKAPAVTYTTNYIPYGQGTTTPAQSANWIYNGTDVTLTGGFYKASAGKGLAYTANTAVYMTPEDNIQGARIAAGGSFKLIVGGSTEAIDANGTTADVKVTTGNLVIGTSGKGIDFSATAAGIIWRTGVGSPEGVVTAAVGSLYTRSDGGVGTTLYVKQSGTGNTGWAAK